MDTNRLALALTKVLAVKNWNDIANKIYKSKDVKDAMGDISKFFPLYNDVKSSDHEEAIQYVLDSIDEEIWGDYSSDDADDLRSHLNDMIAGGIS